MTVGEVALAVHQLPAGAASLQFGAGAPVSLDEGLRLRSVGDCSSGGACLAVGTAQYAETGSDPYVSWGRWTNGSIAVGGTSPNTPLSSNQGVHYLVGVPSVTMPTSGTFSYSLIGATSPTASDGSMAPGSFRANATVHFAPASQTRIGLEAQVTMATGQYKFSTPGGLGNASRSGMPMDGATTFSGQLQTQRNAGSGNFDCGSSGCQVNVTGGFFGPEAARMGLGYSILDPGAAGRTISGVGVLENK